MELLHQPYGPWHLIAAIAAIIAALLLLGRWGKDKWRALSRRPWARGTIVALSLLTLGLMTWAVWNPRAIQRGGSEHIHLEFLLDVSESMRRDAPAFARQQQAAEDWAKAQMLATPKAVRKRGTVGITTFGRTAVSAGKARPLADAAKAVSGLRESEFASGGESDLAAGLRQAAERVDQEGGRGAIVLLSDGHATVGDPLEAARELGAKGVPILVLPAEGSPPALAMSAVDLPSVVESDLPTRLRGGIANQLGKDIKARMEVGMNPGLPKGTGPHGASSTTSNAFEIADGQWARFRPELTFEGYGLQVVEVTLAQESTDAEARPPQRRRFYTQVKRPPRLLSIGDNRWLAALRNSDFEVIQKQAQDITADMNLADVDAIVLSGVPGSRFSPEVQEAFSKAVKDGGTGLFFINGSHPGDEKLPTILASYFETPVGELLPVVPRKATFQPPERNVILMLDTSGSMGGWEKVMKQISRSIVGRLRPGDKLDVIAFTTGADHAVKDLLMTDANKKKAIASIDKLGIGGGTSPKAALDLIATRKFVEGGLIFISDGGFSPGDISDSIRRRPDLRVTVFSCGGNHYGTLQKLADPITVNRNFDASKIKIPYFGEKKDNRYFDKELFAALPMPDLRRDDQLPLPNIAITGSAFSRMRGDGILVGVRPKYAVPVLATRPVGAGRTAIWTTGLDNEWIRSDGPGGNAGPEAVTAWLRQLVGFNERDRYDFQLEEDGDVLTIKVSILPTSGRVPRVERLNARLLLPDGITEGIRLVPDGFVRGQFTGEIPRPRLTTAQRAFLVLSEEGDDALAGRQRIPIVLLPPRATESAAGREDWTHGVNESMLLALAQTSGGAWHPEPGTHLASSQQAITRNRALWPWLALLSGLCLLIAVGIRRLTP